MKTKAEIVQALLDKDAITAEEAVTLLMKDKEYVYIPNPLPVAPYNPCPWAPGQPYWYADIHNTPFTNGGAIAVNAELPAPPSYMYFSGN